jgi:hypothetical protein
VREEVKGKGRDEGKIIWKLSEINTRTMLEDRMNG